MTVFVSIMLAIHIATGCVGMLSGSVSLFSSKGGWLHRLSGQAFLASMLAMAATGAFVAFMRERPDSTIAGVLTFYLVATGWMAVRTKPSWLEPAENLAPFLAASVGVYAMLVGLEAAASATGRIRGFPAGFYFGQATLAALMIVLDLSVLVRGGLTGASRIARHLWRMGFAMFVSATAIFLGNPQVFPEAVRRIEILAAPVAIITIVTLYWLIRIRIGSHRPRRASVGAES